MLEQSSKDALGRAKGTIEHLLTTGAEGDQLVLDILDIIDDVTEALQCELQRSP